MNEPLDFIDGDGKRKLTERGRDFAERNLGAGFMHANRLLRVRKKFRRLDRDTFVQETSRSVAEATLSWTESKGAFSNYVRFHVRRNLQRALRQGPVVTSPTWFAESWLSGKTDADRDRAARCLGGMALHPKDDLRAYSPEADRSDVFPAAYRVLCGRQAEVVRMLYQEGMSLKEVARRLGVKFQRVQHLRDRALQRLARVDFGQ